MTSGLQPPSEAPTSGAQVMTNSFITANWVNGLTFLLNPPIFQGYNSTTQSIPTGGSGTAVLLNSEVIDSYSGHSTTTNTSRYVGQAPGYYQVSGSVAFSPNTTGDRKVFAAVNGTPVPYNCAQVFANQYTDATSVSLASVFVYLNGTTDYVELYVVQNSGAALNINPNTTNESGMSVLWVHS